MLRAHEFEPSALPQFAALAPAARARLLDVAMVHAVSAGTVIFDQGESPTFQQVVLSGSVHLFGRSSENREVLIGVVEPPDFVVPAATVTASPYLVQARTLEPCKLLLIHAEAFRAAVREQPALAQAVIESLSGQFRGMVRQIKNLKLRSAQQRVGCYVLALSRRQSARTVVLPYEKGLIASELGMTRESFSRALAALQHEGLSINGDTLTILDLDRLTAASRPDPLIDPDEACVER